MTNIMNADVISHSSLGMIHACVWIVKTIERSSFFFKGNILFFTKTQAIISMIPRVERTNDFFFWFRHKVHV